MDPGCLIRTITTICVPLVFGLIVFVGIFGNALVIIVVTTNAQAGTIHKKRNGMKGWVGPKVCANCKPHYGNQDFFPLVITEMGGAHWFLFVYLLSTTY